jgi:hypothetical protein
MPRGNSTFRLHNKRGWGNGYKPRDFERDVIMDSEQPLRGFRNDTGVSAQRKAAPCPAALAMHHAL